MANLLLKRIKDWSTSITSFRTGDVIPVDGPNGTAKMSKDDLLQITADNIVQKFTENTINIVNDFVSHNGKIYRCIQENAYVWRGERYVEVSYDEFVKSKAKELTKGQLEYLPFKRYFGELLWRNTSVNIGTGSITTSSNRVTTAPKIYMAKGTKIIFPTENSNLQHTILGFSSDDYTPEFVDVSKRLYGGLSWESSKIFTVPTDSYVIIQCKYSDDSNISPSDSDVGGISVEFVVKFGTDNLSSDVSNKLNSFNAQDIPNLKKGQLEYLPFKRFIANDYTWQNAKYNVGTQQIVADSARALTNESKFMAKSTEIIFDLTGLDYQYTILGFDGQGNRLFGGGSWGSKPKYVVPQDCYIRIQMRHSNNSKFDLTGFDGSFISFKFVAKFGVDNLADDVVAKLNELAPNVVDLFLFAGQSNMAGRGATSADHPETAPTILTGAGYEYRSISDPTKLYPIAEPFGVNENKTGGISEPGAKTGSMVTSFVNAYYSATKTTVIGVSASKGGTRISEWKSDGVLLPDALQRLSDAVSFLTDNGYTIRHKYVLWCQGESDGDHLTKLSDYKSDFNSVLASFKMAGIEKMFIVRIGRINSGDHTRYDYIIDAQTEVCQENKDVVMASTDFYSMQARGLMKDIYHYYQEGYNEVGNYAGANVGAYVALGGKEQTMFDPKSNNLYFTNKN